LPHRTDTATAVPPLDTSPSGRLPHVVAVAEPRMGRPLHRDPTGTAAVSRTASRPAPSAPVPELRTRLCRAVQGADGAGALLLAHHIRRAVE
jgi:hypothetical protein